MYISNVNEGKLSWKIEIDIYDSVRINGRKGGREGGRGWWFYK